MVFEDYLFKMATVDLSWDWDVARVRAFLAAQGFDYDPARGDRTMVVETHDGRICATASLSGDVLMYVAASPQCRNTESVSRLVAHLQEIVFASGKATAFVFTRPGNRRIFESLGYAEIATAEPLITLLEFGYRTIRDFQRELASRAIPTCGAEPVAAIVMNANPFTKGHRHLVEEAASDNHAAYVFVVQEDCSAFPFAARFDLARCGLADLDNVAVLPGGRYMVSTATFPAYFLKAEDPGLIARKQAELDATVFARWIAPALGVSRRYVGDEPFSPTTAVYNEAMRSVLAEHGMALAAIPRLRLEGSDQAVSASWVRRQIALGAIESAFEAVPAVTREYLSSAAASPFIARLRESREQGGSSLPQAPHAR
ncbi:[citrate (pro-3S)-lyase] ligase [Desulfovibrio sp. JY]|nr:[citrate (pro-3S)-lyase] ligase [Desulfovibrio sp. JY]